MSQIESQLMTTFGGQVTTAALSLGAGLLLGQVSVIPGPHPLDETYAVDTSTSNPIPRQNFDTSSKYPSNKGNSSSK